MLGFFAGPQTLTGADWQPLELQGCVTFNLSPYRGGFLFKSVAAHLKYAQSTHIFLNQMAIHFSGFGPKSPKFCQCKFWMTLFISIPEALEEVAIKPGETIFSACSDAEIEGFDSKALPGSALTDVALDPKLDKDPLKLDEKKID